MKKYIIYLLAIVLFIFPQVSFAKSKLEKAKDLVTIGKTHEARKLLSDAIVADPLNAGLHYEAGVLYWRLRQVGDFNLAMKNSCQLERKYCKKVAKLYRGIAFDILSDLGNANNAAHALKNAFSFDQSIAQESLAKLFNFGKSYLKHRDIPAAGKYFFVLNYFDPRLKESIAKVYFASALEAPSEAAILLFAKSASYSKTNDFIVGNALADMAKNKEITENERESLKRAAGKYLSKNEMLTHFPPDYKIYQPGTYTFNMKAEETTDHWIQIANGSYGYSIKSNDDQFIVKYFDGEEVSAWSPGNWPDKYKFKIKAISSQPITFVVK